MEKKDCGLENIKIYFYLVQNIIDLNKKRNINNVLLVCKNDKIYLESNNVVYKINNMIEYKNVINTLSNEYKTILKYIPKLDDIDMYYEIESQYEKTNNVLIKFIGKKIYISYISCFII